MIVGLLMLFILLHSSSLSSLYAFHSTPQERQPLKLNLFQLYKAARAPLPKAFSGAGTGAASAAMKCKCVTIASAVI
jgi:hypothetical protein